MQIDLLTICTKFKPPTIQALRDCSLVTPIEQRAIRVSLQGPSRSETLQDLWLRTHDPFFEYLNRLMDLIPNPYFNPGNLPYAGSRYYERSESFYQLDDLLSPPVQKGFITNFALVGHRGSGKTLTVNCWLAERQSQLDANRIFWVRCDAVKLYQLWHNGLTADPTELPSLQDYLDVQLLYVFCKYCTGQNRPFIEKLLEEIRQSKYQFALPTRPDGSYLDTPLYNQIMLFHERIHQVERTRPRHYSYALEEILRRPGSRATRKREWLATSTGLQQFLNRNNCRLLMIVDGVDNIDLLDSTSIPYYQQMIAFARAFLHERPPFGSGQLRLVTARNSTYKDMNSRFSTQKDTLAAATPTKIEHFAPRLKRVALKRIEVAIAEELTPPNLLRLPETAQRRLLAATIQAQKSSDSDNLKGWLRNRLNVLGQLHFRATQTGNPAQYSKRISPRYLFLNDRLFLATDLEGRPGPVEAGYIYPNPFYFNRLKITNVRPWLLCIRILQTLEAVGSLTTSELISVLRELFGYSRDQIVGGTQLLKEYGLLDAGAPWENTEVISAKAGRRFLGIIFENIDCLYYLALDTPLPNFLLPHVMAYSNLAKPSHPVTNFPVAAITTGLAFLRLIISIDALEQEAATEAGATNLDQYRLPIFEPHTLQGLHESISNQLRWASESERESVLLKIDRLSNL